MTPKKKENYQQTIKIPKPVIFSAKALQFISTNLASNYVKRLFSTPIKHKIPKRELHMDAATVKEKLHITSIKKDIVVYIYGENKSLQSEPNLVCSKKILLVHGWSGRGTQLVKIADALLKEGYCTISFDAPSHGRSPGKTSNMLEFIDAVMEVDKQYGPFEAAIGHSLGSMALLNAVKNGLPLRKMVLIGSGDKIDDIIYDFTNKLGLKKKVGDALKKDFDKIAKEDVNNFSAGIAATAVKIPVLLFHDEDDLDSPLSSSKNIRDNLKNPKLIVTKELGHRKILGNDEVIDKLIGFIKVDS